jgi:replicative DNA helicase
MVLAYLTGINESRFNYGDLTKEERERISVAIYIMKTYDNFTVIKMPSPTIELVKTLVRENCLVKNISYVFFDYIFINPSLLATFQGFSLRNDEVLLMFATALKDLAVELNVAMFTSTQVNANADDNKNIRNEASLAGGRSTINKADNGCILARPAKEELETLEPIISKYGVPNLVLDIFKVRSGQWSQVRVWIKANLGTMRFQDLFVTDSRLEFIDGILVDEHEVYNWDDEGYKRICKEMEKCNLKKCSLNV